MSEPTPGNGRPKLSPSNGAPHIEPARPDDLWLSVHALSEWVFCPRAGLIAASQRDGSRDRDDLRPNLDYSPCYELQQIEYELSLNIRRFILWSVVSLVLICVAIWAGYQPQPLLAVVSVLGFLVTCRRVPHSLSVIKSLLALRRMALAAKPKTINLPLANVEPAKWWELLAAGYQSVSYPEPLKDEDARIIGCPWRVLRLAGLRIPVIEADSQDGTTRIELRDTHHLRLTAYRHLLIHCEAAEVPFGVVLSRNSYEGWVVPFIEADAKNLAAAVQQFRGTLRTNDDPRPPQPTCCTRCPHGIPSIYRPGRETRLGNVILRVFGLRSRDHKLYHSTCGDRFRWCPPHEDAVSIGLPADFSGQD